MSLAQTTQETLGLMKESLSKSVTISTGLNAYDLQAPAKNLYPVITPLRNSLPRVQRQNPGDAARWRTIASITGSGFDSMGWVPEGQRSASMSYVASPMVAPYMTLGEEDTISFEAEAAAQGFEDLNSTATLRILQKTMRKEETALLGGNTSVALGTPSAPTLTASGSGATLPAATYSVIVVALTFEGYRNSSLSAGIATTKVITGNDGNTFTINGGSSNRSSNALQAVTLGQTLYASATVVNGAVAYAWFVGAAGSETLQAISSLNSATFATPLLGGQQLASVGDRGHLAQSDAGLRRPADGRVQSRQQRLRSVARDRDIRHGHIPDRFRSRLGQRDRPDAGHHVEQLSAVADRDLRQRAGTEEHHQQVPDQRFGTADPLQRRRRPEPGRPLRHLGLGRGALVLQPVQRRRRLRHSDPRCIPTFRPARSSRSASACRSGINRTRRRMSPRSSPAATIIGSTGRCAPVGASTASTPRKCSRSTPRSRSA